MEFNDFRDGERGQRHESSPVTDGSTSPSVAGSDEDENAETLSSSPSDPEKAPAYGGLPTRNHTKAESSIAENPFDTEASRVLFDAIDRFQSCGAGEYIDIPQLVIVGGQSTGKSSLLKTLTDIPFPVGMDCCTRFATRIVSRRTAPGTSNQVKITIVPPNFKVGRFAMTPPETYREFAHVKESLTAEEFADTVEEASTYLGINPGKGMNRKNFALEVLKVEISGPTRSHFSILDIPGIFSYDFNVRDGEMAGVQTMVAEYMKQPENIVICVADATTDLARQEIFKLADQYVDRARLIGVFTKCDLLDKPDSVVAMASGRVEGVDRLLHHGWFVVRNRVEGERDDDPDFDLETVEQKMFSTHPWTDIREQRRGSSKLKRYLGKLLCDKIKVSFPRLLAELGKLLGDSETQLARLGEARTTHHQRRAYLAGIAQGYELRAREALERPWLLDEVNARARNIVRENNDAFGTMMRKQGHVYEFEDHDLREDECLIRLKEILLPDAPQETKSQSTNQVSDTTTSESWPRKTLKPTSPSASIHDSTLRENSILSSQALFDKIREEVRICGCTELPGVVHPDVIRRLYKDQTQKWHGEAESHLRAVATAVRNSAQELLGSVVPQMAEASVLHEGLRLIMDQLYGEALKRALVTLKAYCDGDRAKLLQTTDPGFMHRLRLLQSLRMMKGIQQAIQTVNAKRDDHSVEDLSLLLLSGYHHSSERNTVYEVHDALKVYYQFSLQSFIRHIINTIIEDFVTDPNGPLRGFSTKFIYELPNDEVDRLGCESRDVVEKRQLLNERIGTLKAAQETAREAMDKTSRME